MRLGSETARGCGKARESAIGTSPFRRLPRNAFENAGTNKQGCQQSEDYGPTVETQIELRARRRLLHMRKLLDITCLVWRRINGPMQDGLQRLATTTGGE